jgi:hypothetical protein
MGMSLVGLRITVLARPSSNILDRPISLEKFNKPETTNSSFRIDSRPMLSVDLLNSPSGRWTWTAYPYRGKQHVTVITCNADGEEVAEHRSGNLESSNMHIRQVRWHLLHYETKCWVHLETVCTLYNSVSQKFRVDVLKCTSQATKSCFIANTIMYVQWSRNLRGGYILKTALKPKITYSQNYPWKFLKSPKKYVLFMYPVCVSVYSPYRC